MEILQILGTGILIFEVVFGSLFGVFCMFFRSSDEREIHFLGGLFSVIGAMVSLGVLCFNFGS